MRVSRDVLLRTLEAVSPGLSPREIIEQSSCFVFKDGKVITFNDEIACQKDSPLTDVAGAVQADPLLTLLRKLQEEELDIEQTESELIVKGKGRRAGIRMEKDVLLPVDTVEQPNEWKALDTDFGTAIGTVKECAGKDDSQFILTCVHITPTFVEACDNFQLVRYPIETSVQADALLRKSSISAVTGLDMTEFSESAAWLHFRNPAGLIVSCRRYLEDYPDLGNILEVNGDSLVLPGGLAEAAEKADIFSSVNSESNNLTIELKPGKLLIEGRGPSGWFQERKPIVYEGSELRFMIAPKLLIEITKRSNECKVAPGRLIVDNGKFRFVGCLGVSNETPAA